jgi:hypothetical protein|eukprot:SAG25_NODE_9_length_28981_cov_95.245274_13_plen_88_part_00
MPQAGRPFRSEVDDPVAVLNTLCATVHGYQHSIRQANSLDYYLYSPPSMLLARALSCAYYAVQHNMLGVPRSRSELQKLWATAVLRR